MVCNKCVLLVIDGMADLPDPSRNLKKTPLELSKTPNLDKIAMEGKLGYVHSIGYWKIGGSDTSHVALLGYDPWKTYTGRGPIEVAGTHVDLKPGDVSIRCNYCTVGKDFILEDRTAGYVREGIEDLARAINEKIILSDDKVKFEFRNSADYRCVVYFRGSNISANISDMDPSYDIIVDTDQELIDIKQNPRIVDCKPRDDTLEAAHMADLLNEWVRKVYKVLDSHPVNIRRKKDGKPIANCIMPRGPGETPIYESFEQKWGLKGACVAGTGLIKGIGKLTRMAIPDVPGATGYIDSDLLAKAKKTISLLKNGCDFILVHIEGTDEVSHDKNLEQKIMMLEKSDQMLGHLMDNVPAGTLICTLSDHSTPIVKGDHTADPSPLGLWMKDAPNFGDGIEKFSEKTACLGSLDHVEGKDLMPILLNYMEP